MSRAAASLARLSFARDYSRRLFESVPDEQWYEMPGGVTHVAWQVGHLAVAEFRLCLFRARGPQPGDESIMPQEVIDRYGKDSAVAGDPTARPAPADIRAILDRVHAQVLTESSAFPDADLDLPICGTHLLCRTRGELLEWVSAHELVHAGQIALLRRQLGHKPLW